MRRRDSQPFPSDKQMRAFAHVAAKLNSTRRGALEMEQLSVERRPIALSKMHGSTVPPSAIDAHESFPAGIGARERGTDRQRRLSRRIGR